MCAAQYLMNQLVDFNLDLIFKVTARLNPPKLSQKVFVCMLSQGPLDGMLPNLQAYINRTGSIAY